MASEETSESYIRLERDVKGWKRTPGDDPDEVLTIPAGEYEVQRESYDARDDIVEIVDDAGQHLRYVDPEQPGSSASGAGSGG